MSGPGAVVEEAPVLVGLYMTIEAVLAWVIERALLLIWIFTIGALLVALGNVLTYDKYFVHIHWGGPFFRLNDDVHNWLVEQVLVQEYAIGWWWHQTANVGGWIAYETWATMRDVFRWGVWMSDVYVPTYVHGVADVIGHRAKAAGHVATAAAQTAVATARVVTIPHAGELQWIHKHWKALTRAVAAGGAIELFPPLAIPKIWHGIDELKDRLSHHNKRLHQLEVATGAAAFAALMANVLGLPDWRCLTRGNLGKASRAICGAPSRWLTNLLLGLILIEGAMNLRQFTKLVYDLTDDAARQIRNFWQDDLSGKTPNPGLGETGAPAFLNTNLNYVPANPGLGEAA